MTLLNHPLNCVGIVAVLIFFMYIPTSHGICAVKNLCCKGKNITCYSYIWDPFDNKPLKCFCDESCYKTGDCCPDYQELCKPPERVDCIVSSWSKWSECRNNEDKCSYGTQARGRQIIRLPKNGGERCPPLIQKTVCLAPICRTKRGSASGASTAARHLLEVARIIPSRFGKWRDHKDFSMKKDIRQNLYWRSHHSNDFVTDSKCSRYILRYVSRGCRTSPIGWAHDLRPGMQVCVSCQPHVMNSVGSGGRCRGFADRYGRISRWKSVGVTFCRGTWLQVSNVKNKCDCPANVPNSYIIV